MKKLIAQLLWLLLLVSATWPQAQPKLTPSPTPQATAPATASGSCAVDYYLNSNSVCVHRPVKTQGSVVPQGATAQCRDGSYLFSQHRRGTCSRHGGVANWLQAGVHSGKVFKDYARLAVSDNCSNAVFVRMARNTTQYSAISFHFIVCGEWADHKRQRHAPSQENLLV